MRFMHACMDAFPADPETASGRTVWLLTDDRPGNRTQVVGVARALGWPAQEKRLAFNERQSSATPRLGASLETLDDASRKTIAPPWPDLVLAAGRRAVPVARHVKAASGGRARIVLIGRRTPAEGADLVIRCSYFRQAPSPNLLELTLPPTQVDAAMLRRVKAEQPDPLAGLKRPVCVFLVGGETGRHRFEPDFVERMARDVATAAHTAGASLAIVTSRRTGAGGVAALKRGASEATLHEWRADAVSNPFLALLANADILAVTGESESMLAEAAASGKPLTIYPLVPRPLSPRLRIRAAIASAATGNGPLAPLFARLMNAGWVSPRRDLSELHVLIERRGWGRVFDGALNRVPPAPFEEGAVAARRIEALFGSG